eukprot:gene6722-63_t
MMEAQCGEISVRCGGCETVVTAVPGAWALLRA